MPETAFTDVRRFVTIDSTNRYLLDEARAGAPAGVVAVADHQTAGRGRLGRTWEAPAGMNILLSVLLRPDVPVADRYLTTSAVALAALDGIAMLDLDLAGADRIGVKWPNDLVAADGRKLAGVLAEADPGPATAVGPAPVVVGIGVNVNWPTVDADLPAALSGTAVSLRQLAGREVDREALLAALLVSLGHRVDDLDTVPGRARLAGDVRAACVTLGTRVRVELAGESFEGMARSITDEGHLVVDADGVERTVVAGDVVHVRPGG